MSRFDVAVADRLGEITVLRLSGRSTPQMAPLLRRTLDAQLEADVRGLLLDAAALEEIEGDCFYEILLADRQLRARRGALAVYGLPEPVAASMRRAGLLDDLSTFADFAAARRAVELQMRQSRLAAAAARILSEARPGGGASRRRRLRRKTGERLARLVTRILAERDETSG